MFEFFFVNVYRDARVSEMFQSTRMVQVQMTHNDCLDILYIVTSSFNCLR